MGGTSFRDIDAHHDRLDYEYRAVPSLEPLINLDP